METGGEDEIGAISIVMPAHNEARYLEAAVNRLVDDLRRRPEPFEILIVENGSADDTAVVAARLSGIHPEISVIRLDRADYGAALRAGFLAATGEIVVNFDVDFVDLGFLQNALTVAAKEGADMVVGTKRGAGAEDRRSYGRRMVTALFSLSLRMAFGLHVSDTHGLKLLRRRPMAPLVTACTFGQDIFDTELVLRAERAGLDVAEVPVLVTDQRPPRTSIVGRIPRSLVGLARLRVSLWRR